MTATTTLKKNRNPIKFAGDRRRRNRSAAHVFNSAAGAVLAKSAGLSTDPRRPAAGHFSSCVLVSNLSPQSAIRAAQFLPALTLMGFARALAGDGFADPCTLTAYKTPSLPSERMLTPAVGQLFQSAKGGGRMERVLWSHRAAKGWQKRSRGGLHFIPSATSSWLATRNGFTARRDWPRPSPATKFARARPRVALITTFPSRVLRRQSSRGHEV